MSGDDRGKSPPRSSHDLRSPRSVLESRMTMSDADADHDTSTAAMTTAVDDEGSTKGPETARKNGAPKWKAVMGSLRPKSRCTRSRSDAADDDSTAADEAETSCSEASTTECSDLPSTATSGQNWAPRWKAVMDTLRPKIKCTRSRSNADTTMAAVDAAADGSCAEVSTAETAEVAHTEPPPSATAAGQDAVGANNKWKSVMGTLRPKRKNSRSRSNADTTMTVDDAADTSGTAEESTADEAADIVAAAEPTETPSAPAAGQDGGPKWKSVVGTWRAKTMSTLVPSIRMLSTRTSGIWPFHAAITSRAAAEEDHCVVRNSLRTFSLSELKKATGNFSKENVVGKGGHAKVYKGCLPDGQLIAVKRLSPSESANKGNRVEKFLSELGNMVNVRHPNLATLVGVCVEGGEHLVFPFSRLGCLSGLLLGTGEETLPWEARYKVAAGIARGLEHLHENCARRIVHRDLKPANILLQDDYEPMISDFGLAKWLPATMPHMQVDTLEGTFGYVPPEYTTHGIFNEKTDVYAYGVVLLQLITGRHAIDTKNLSLVTWAKQYLEGEDEIRKMVDPALAGKYEKEQIGRVAYAAELCIHPAPSVRPLMSQVVRIFEGEETHEKLRLAKRTSDRTAELKGTNGNDNATIMSRHMALAFDFELLSPSSESAEEVEE